MSYSFRVQAATKLQAEQRVGEQFDAIIRTQPIHRADTDRAFEAVRGFLSLIDDDPPRAAVPAVLETEDQPGIAEIPAYPGREIVVSVHGSVSSVNEGVTIQAANVSISVGYSSHV